MKNKKSLVVIIALAIIAATAFAMVFLFKKVPDTAFGITLGSNLNGYNYTISTSDPNGKPPVIWVDINPPKKVSFLQKYTVLATFDHKIHRIEATGTFVSANEVVKVKNELFDTIKSKYNIEFIKYGSRDWGMEYYVAKKSKFTVIICTWISKNYSSTEISNDRFKILIGFYDKLNIEQILDYCSGKTLNQVDKSAF